MLSLAKKNLLILSEESNGIVTSFKVVIDTMSPLFEENDFGQNVARTLWFMSEEETGKAAESIVKHGLHIKALAHVWSHVENRNDLVSNTATSYLFLMFLNLAVPRSLREGLMKLKLQEVASMVLKQEAGTKNALKAMLILLFLYGDQEAESLSLISTFVINNEEINRLLNTLNRTIEGDEVSFNLPLLSAACLVLAISDSNKQLLVENGYIPSLLHMLKNFQENEKPRDVGGGGDDLTTAEQSLQTLMHLAFHFETNQGLRTAFTSSTIDGKELIEQLAENQKLDEELRQRVNRLLVSRLKDTVSADEARKSVSVSAISISVHSSAQKAAAKVETLSKSEQTEKDDAAPLQTEEASFKLTVATENKVNDEDAPSHKHVMLSYCWGSTANPAFVKQLATELRNLGYDVWRDEDGSTIVPAMSGSVNDRMAEAIEFSDTIVVCVSAAYKLSENCRYEADYASTCAKRKEVKLLFVMMNEEYTTVSKPKHCDGWLGILVGGNFWVPMWKQEMVSSAAKTLAASLDPVSK